MNFDPPDWIQTTPDIYEIEALGMALTAEIRYHKMFHSDRERKRHSFVHLTFEEGRKWLMSFDGDAVEKKGGVIPEALKWKLEGKIREHLIRPHSEYGPFDWFMHVVMS